MLQGYESMRVGGWVGVGEVISKEKRLKEYLGGCRVGIRQGEFRRGCVECVGIKVVW